MKEHSDFCPARPQQCLYCELSVRGDKLMEHQDYCGSKTRKCPDCNQNITLKEFEEHKYNGKCDFLKELE